MLWASFSALIIGMSLGLLGSGGSLLTVPVLIFIMHRPEKIAITESLAIVGLIALVGSIPYGIRRHIHWRSVLFFGLPGMLGAYLGACGSYYISGKIQLILFACVMLVVSGLMLFRPLPSEPITGAAERSVWRIMGEGCLVGCLTGLIGIGGGFMIVPALVLLSHLSMVMAIGTSLSIITINASISFIKQLSTLNALGLQVDWTLIGFITISGIVGSFSGSWIVKYIPQMHLKKFFGLSLLLMGVFILIRQI